MIDHCFLFLLPDDLVVEVLIKVHRLGTAVENSVAKPLPADHDAAESVAADF